MTELTMDMNWIGVVAGAILAFIAGWLWYSRWLFGLRWAKVVGVDHSQKPPLFPMGLQILGLFLMSWFVGIMAREGLLLATILVTLASVILGYAGETFARQAADAKLVNGGYWLAAVAVMIVMQALT